MALVAGLDNVDPFGGLRASAAYSEMATQADVRRIALGFPGAVEATNDFAFSIPVNGKAKGFAWCWKERIDPKKPRVPNHSVLVVHVASNLDKDLMMRAEPDKYIFDPHYNGYAAVIFPLAKVRVPELRQLLTESHHCVAAPPRRKRK